jgi:hypothetical protein
VAVDRHPDMWCGGGGNQQPEGQAAALGVVEILAWGSSFYLPAVLAGPVAETTGWPLAGVVGGLKIDRQGRRHGQGDEARRQQQRGERQDRPAAVAVDPLQPLAGSTAPRRDRRSRP